MTPEANSVDTVATLKQQLEALSREVAALAATQSTGRRVRLALAGLTIALCLVIVISFYRLATGIVAQDNLDRVMKVAEKRLQTRSDDYMRQVQFLVDRSSPVISDALSQQVKKDLPSYLRIMEEERDQFAEDLQKNLSGKIRRKYDQELARHEQILHKEFPQINDPVLHQRMVKNLQVAVERRIEKTYVGELQRELDKLYATWDDFPAATPARKSDIPLEDQLVANLLRLLQIKLSNTQTVAAN
jgi:hypothetical protein